MKDMFNNLIKNADFVAFPDKNMGTINFAIVLNVDNQKMGYTPAIQLIALTELNATLNRYRVAATHNFKDIAKRKILPSRVWIITEPSMIPKPVRKTLQSEYDMHFRRMKQYEDDAELKKNMTRTQRLQYNTMRNMGIDGRTTIDIDSILSA